MSVHTAGKAVTLTLCLASRGRRDVLATHARQEATAGHNTNRGGVAGPVRDLIQLQVDNVVVRGGHWATNALEAEGCRGSPMLHESDSVPHTL
jgi:hypothetical protein